MTSRFARACLPLLAVAALAACEGGGASRFLSIGTGGTGGVYYPLGGALASRLSEADTTRQYTAEVTGGSVENVNRVAQGQIDLGFTLAVTAYEAYNGGLGFDSAVTSLRVVAPLYPNVVHVLVPGNSPARSVEDLRGRRVSVGSAGSGTEQTSQQILEAHGLTYGDISVRYLSFSESASALRDGALDAAIISVGYPAAAVLEATTTGDARLLPITGERVRELRERYPYYSVGTIPASAYPGVTEDIPTIAMNNWLVARDDLPDDVVVNLLNVLRDARVSLTQVHDVANQIDLAALDDAPIPLHPAAEAWAGRGR